MLCLPEVPVGHGCFSHGNACPAPNFKLQINIHAVGQGHMRLPWVWDVLIKYVLCTVLPALMLTSAYNDIANTSRGYGNYPVWLQVRSLLWGMSCLAGLPRM